MRSAPFRHKSLYKLRMKVHHGRLESSLKLRGRGEALSLGRFREGRASITGGRRPAAKSMPDQSDRLALSTRHRPHRDRFVGQHSCCPAEVPAGGEKQSSRRLRCLSQGINLVSRPCDHFLVIRDTPRLALFFVSSIFKLHH